MAQGATGARRSRAQFTLDEINILKSITNQSLAWSEFASQCPTSPHGRQAVLRKWKQLKEDQKGIDVLIRMGFNAKHAADGRASLRSPRAQHSIDPFQQVIQLLSAAAQLSPQCLSLVMDMCDHQLSRQQVLPRVETSSKPLWNYSTCWIHMRTKKL